jgi:hypothetical protein
MAKIKLNNNEYPIPDSALAGLRADFIAHLGTIAGNGLKVTLGGVEYGIDSSKVAGAFGNLENVFEELENNGQNFPNIITFDGNSDGKENILYGTMVAYTKISDIILTEEELLNIKATVNVLPDEILKTYTYPSSSMISCTLIYGDHD